MVRRKLSLKTTICLTLLLVVSSILLTASALFGAMRSRDQVSAACQQAAAIGDLAAEDLLWHVRRHPQGDLHEWLGRVSAWPRLHSITIMQDNSVLAESKTWSLTLAQVRLARHHNVPTMIPLDERAANGHELVLQVQPVGDKQTAMKLLLVLAIAPDPGIARMPWGFFLPLAAAGFLGICIAVVWLSHEVVRPIELLSKVSSNPTLASHLSRPAGALQYAELNGLARTLQGLHMDLDQWRHKADHLERTFNTRVEEQTRRMSRTLQRAQREVWRDPLTGLYNRRMLMEHAQKMIDEQIRAGGDVSLLMFDVDHFKTLNDTLGHMAGDEMLQFVAQLLKQAIRREDVAVRYGGDEFLLLLPGVPVADAEQIACRAIALFRQHTKLLRDLEPRPTLSAGVTSVATTGARQLDQLMQLADGALYEAKRGGKNRVGVCNSHAAPVASASASVEKTQGSQVAVSR